MPMKTEEPSEPAGQVPIGGWSSAARAKRGSAVAASNPPPALSTARRVDFAVLYDFMNPSLYQAAVVCQRGALASTRRPVGGHAAGLWPALAPNISIADAIADVLRQS